LATFAAIWLRDSTSVPKEAEPFALAFRAITGKRTYFIVLGEAALIAISSWVFANWLPLYFRESYGLTLAAAGFSGTFALTAGMMTGVTAGGYFSDRLSRGDLRRRLLMQGTLYLCAAPLLITFLAHPPLPVLGAAIFLHGLLRSLGSVNELPVLCDLLPPQRRSTAVGFMNALNTFIGGSGVLISGIIKSSGGLGIVFTGLAAVVSLAGLVCLSGYRWTLPHDLKRKAAENV
jgi:predicted MFS family arabinose efflux permease